MPDLFIYLIKANIALVLFYLGYRYGLRRLTFYTLNRYFLLLGIVLSATFPVVNLRALLGPRQSIAVVQYAPNWNLVQGYVAVPASVSLWEVLTYVFWGGVAVMTIRFILQLLSITRIHLRSTDEVIFRQKVRRMDDRLNPFSFFGHIYVNPALHPPRQLRDVIAHERVHVRGWHSLDILMAEIHKIIYWFNPGVWLMKRAVVENLEFITDRRILHSGVDRRDYQYSLVGVGSAARGVPMVNHFNLAHLKKRIIMMNRTRSTRVQLLRYLLLLPLIGAGTLLISARRGVDRIAVPSAPPAEMTLQGSVLRPVAAPSPGPALFTDTMPPAVKPIPTEQAEPSDTQRATVTSGSHVRIAVPGSAVKRDSAPKQRFPGAIYIVDGKPRDSAYVAHKVPPEDISSISVLKGGEATDLFGSRGAAGVIVVKTKSGVSDARANGLPSRPKATFVYGPKGAKNVIAVRKGGTATFVLGPKDGKNRIVVGSKRGSGMFEPSAHHSDSVKRKSITFTLDGDPTLGSPLILVDHEIVTSKFFTQNLKPDSIRSITVLKGDSAASLFGSKAKNGVIMIETKKPGDSIPQ